MQQELNNRAMQVISSTELCPSLEKLNAFYDGDGSLSAIEYENVAKHVQNCVICQDIIASYDELDSDLSLLLKISDEKLAESQNNVKNRLFEELDLAPKNQKKFNFVQFRTFAYRAAAVLAFAFMGYMILDMKHDLNSRQQTIASTEFKETEIPKYVTKSTDVAKNKFLTQNSVSLDDYQESSYNYDNQLLANQSVLGSSSEEAVVIPSNVKHVWTLDDNLDSLNSTFAKACEATDIFETLDINGDENGFEVTINTSKSKLIALVQYLKGRGMKLLSPQAPQPEDNVFYVNGDEAVTYKAQFITSGEY